MQPLTHHTLQVRSRSRKINFKSRIAVRHATFDFGDEQAVDYHEVQELGHQASDKPDQVETGVDKEEESVRPFGSAMCSSTALDLPLNLTTCLPPI